MKKISVNIKLLKTEEVIKLEFDSISFCRYNKSKLGFKMILGNAFLDDYIDGFLKETEYEIISVDLL